MRTWFVVAAVVAGLGCAPPGPGPVVVVSAAYPGATATVVAETVAAPIENQVNGVEGMTRVESVSGPDGKYTARVYFEPRTDPDAAIILVQKRVALSAPQLPNDVQKCGITITVETATDDPAKAAIAVTDRQGRGWDALEKAAAAVTKRLAADGLLEKPEPFPVTGTFVEVEADRAKCAGRGVTLDDVSRAIKTARGEPADNNEFLSFARSVTVTVKADGPGPTIDALKKVVVAGKVRLGDVTTIREVTGASAVYRVNLYPAVRITGTLPAGRSVADVSGRCVERAKAELKAGYAAEAVAAEKAADPAK